MKKFFLTAAVSLLAISPALAAKTTLEFKRDSGDVNVVTLDGKGGATLADGTATAYSYEAEANKMCFVTGPDTKACVVFAESVPEPKVGDAVRYTADDGAEGTVTVLAIEE
ncbi:MAG: hypothetical protein AAGD92_11280 [Pseudomonadota bacterium]